MMIPKPTADDLRELMTTHGLSVKEIAGIACVHTNTVSSWLADRSLPSFRLMPPRHLNAILAMLPGWIATRASMEKGTTKTRTNIRKPEWEDMADIHIWVIYDHPRDYPEHFIARLWIGPAATDVVIFGDTLDEVRSKLPPGLDSLTRYPEDEPHIVETWF